MNQNDEHEGARGAGNPEEQSFPPAKETVVPDENVEKRRLELEVSKLGLEIEKLRRDTRPSLGSRIIRNLPVLAALTAVVVSVVTVYNTWRSDVETRKMQQFTHVVDAFASTSSSVRAGAAAELGGIARYDDSESRRSQSKAILIAAIGVEREFNVRYALEEALVGLGAGIGEEVKKRRAELQSELVSTFGIGFKPDCNSFGDDIWKIRALQEGIVILARVVAHMYGQPLDLKAVSFRCAVMNRRDFSGAHLEGAIFYQADLSESILRDANLTDARLGHLLMWRTNLAGARFCGNVTGLKPAQVQQAIGWEDAHYTKEFAKELGTPRVESNTCS